VGPDGLEAGGPHPGSDLLLSVAPLREPDIRAPPAAVEAEHRDVGLSDTRLRSISGAHHAEGVVFDEGG
jgi:hypothetical protein